jgi:hypothetical protein
VRGPYDDVAEGQLGSPQDDTTDDEPAPARVRPPGGKALARVLSVIESAGLDEAAAATVEVALGPEVPEEFEERSTRTTASPVAFEGGTLHAPPSVSGAPDGRGAGEEEEDEEDATRADDAEELAAESMAAAERLGPPTGVGPQWQWLGPWTVPNGQTYGASRVNVSGRVASLAVDPRDPAHVLCGAANGGVWESRDRGVTWAPRTDYAATLAVGAVAFDPANPSLAYCGTGEGNAWAHLGAGVLRSTNGGTTWSTRCTTPFVGVGFYDLLVDPGDGQRLVAATRAGLYVSGDAGATWRQRRSARCFTVSIAPGGGTSAEMLAACTDGLFRSTDGTTWTAVTLPGSPGTFTRLAARIAPSDPQVAYAWGVEGTTAYLWRRAGGTWQSIGTPPGVAVHQGWYDWFLGVAPDRATQIYCGAIEVHRGDLAGTTWTWRNITNKGATGASIHPDQHAIAFEPGRPDTVYVGNDGGVYRSPDRGIQWIHCNNGLGITEFEYVADDHGSSRWLIGGTQDNGTNRWTGSPTWDHVADGDGGDCAVHRADPRTVFHSYYGMGIDRSTSKGDWGSWTWLPPPVPAGEGALFYPPFEASATNGQTVAQGGDALYVSRNNATAWVRLTFPNAARSSAMYLPDADTVVVGTTDGRVFRTRWNGSAWSTLALLGTPRTGAYLSDLHVDPRNANRMWATSRTINGGRVFRSLDGGTTWVDRTAGLPNLPVNSVQVDPANASRVWVAADLGVYQTLDGGQSWTDLANGLPHMAVTDLVYHPHARVLRAGTRARGVWQFPVDGWMTQPTCGVQWTGQLAAKETRRWFTHSWPATWHMVWTVMPTTPRPGGPQLTWTVQVERPQPEYATYFITVENLTPAALSFEGRYCILSRY